MDTYFKPTNWKNNREQPKRVANNIVSECYNVQFMDYILLNFIIILLHSY